MKNKNRILPIFCKALLFVVAIIGCCLPTYSAKKSGSTEGTEFWVAFMSNGASPESERTLDCSLYFSLKEPVEEDVVIIVAVNGWQQNVTIPAGQIFVALEKIPNPSTFYVPINDDTGLYHEMVQSRGLHIYTESDVKFSCVGYCRVGEGGSTTQDAMLILPAEYLGKEYYIQTYWATTLSTEFIVVATENNTRVTLVPSVSTRKGHPADEPINVMLNAGDVYLLPSAKFGFGKTDLSGSKVCADKPVAVFTGNEMAKIPVDNSYSADFFMEQMLPLNYWGTEFYMAKAAKTKQNRFNIIAGYDNTEVTVHRGNSATSTEQVRTYTLNAGQTFQTEIETGTSEAMFQMPSALMTTYIETSKPALCYAYLTCGGTNQEMVEDPETFEEITTNWGNPSDAMVPSWKQRIKNISFVTRELIPEAGVTVQKHFVQIIALTSDIGTFTLDGVAVDPSSFSVFYGKEDMSYANLELTTYGVHQIKTTGDGFVGYVYGMTNGQAYQYTLGYNPYINEDSLFIQNQENIMSEYSYDTEELPYMENKGWYQRQEDEWPEGEERLDTAYVCDSTELHFLNELQSFITYDSLVWRVFECDEQGRVLNPNQWIEEQIVENPTSPQTWQYRFILPDQRALPAAERDPFTYYQVQAHSVQKRVLCEEYPAFHDTLKTMIRVNRTYNDTLRKRIACKGDTLYYFLDDAAHTDAHAAEMDTTMFVFANSEELPTDAYTQTYEVGYNAYRRHYLTQAGCDSVVTFELYVCEPTLLTFDTTICENEVLSFPNSQFFQNTVFDHEGTYRDTLKTQGCAAEYGALYDPEHLFDGCDSIWEVNVHICDTFMIYSRDTFCSNGDWSVPYQWLRDGRMQADSLVREIPFTEADAGQWFEYRDTVKTTSCSQCADGGCDSIFVLNLYVAPFYNTPYTEHICGQHFDPEQLALVDNAYSWDLCTSEYVWDTNNERRILKSDIQHMTLGTTNIFVDSLVSQHGCDSITTLTLTRHKAFFENSSWRMTDNQTFTWTGHRDDTVIGPLEMRQEPYIYYDSLQSDYGCDSIYRLEIYVASTFEATQTAQVCDDSVFVWKQHTSTDKYDPLSADGRLLWDRIHEQNVRSSESLGLEAQSTEGDWETLPVGYYELVDSLKMTTIVDGAVIEADSVWILQFTKSPTYSVLEAFKMCDNDTMTWQGRLYAGSQFEGELSGTPYKTVTAGHYTDLVHYQTDCACDSAFYMTLDVYKSFYDRDEVTICQDHPFVWENHEEHTIVNKEGETVDMSRITEQVGIYHLFDRLFNPECPDCEPGKAGCDSIYKLTLTVNPSYKNGREIVVDTAVCRTSLPFEWTGHNMTFVHDTILYDTLKTDYCLCDSVVRLHLTILNDTNRATTHYLCKNDAPYFYAPHGQAYDPDTISVGLHTYVRELEVGTASHNCTYFDTLHLIVSPVYDIQLVDTICQDTEASYEWAEREGRMVYDKQQHKRIQPTAISATQVGTFFFVDSTLTTACPECQPLGGCDSVMTLRLVVLPSYRTEESHQMSQEEIYTWEGITYGGAKTTAAHDVTVTKDTMIVWQHSTAQSGTHTCDSIRILHLQIGQVYRDTLWAVQCANESYTWYGEDAAGQPFVRQTITPNQWEGLTEFATQAAFKTTLNFDSIYYLELTIVPVYEAAAERTYVDSICQGSTFSWDASLGRPLYLTNTATWVSDLATFTPTLPVGLYIFHDSLKTAQTQCDSVWALRLRVDSVYNQTAEFTICENDTLHWENRLYVGRNFNGTYNEENHYQVFKNLPAQEEFKNDTTYHTIHGCDSTWNLVLHIRPSYPIVKETDTTYVHICDNETYTFVDGKTYNTNGEWSISSHAEGDNRINRQVLIDTINSLAFGCDSVVAHVIYIHPTYLLQQYDTVCQDTVNIYWEWENREGRIAYSQSTHQRITPTAIPINVAGNYVYVDSAFTRSCSECPDRGCDSIMILNLTVLPSYYSDTTVMMSSEETTTWEGVTYGGIATNKEHDITVTKDTIITKHWETHVVGSNRYCDSTRVLYLRIGKVFRDTLRAISCGNEAYIWMGTNHNSQDSVRRVIQPSEWESNTSFSTFDKHTTILGFDSIYYLELSILPYYPVTPERTHDDSICQGSTYAWTDHNVRLYLTNNNQWIDTPSDYVTSLPVGLYIFHDSLKTAQTQCDSVWALRLRVDSVYNQTAEFTICENDTLHWENRLYVGRNFNGTYNEENHYQVFKNLPAQEEFKNDTTYHTIYGCDSTWNLVLHIRPSYPIVKETDTTYVHICDNETYTFVDGKTYNTNGEWSISSHAEGDNRINRQVLIDTINSLAFGCDSVVAHVIYIHPTYLLQQYDTVCQDTVNIYWEWENREGRIAYSQSTHQRITPTAIPINVAGNYVYVDSAFTRSCSECPDRGCDSIMILNLTVLPSYQIDIKRTMSDEDSIHWEGTTYMGTKCPYTPSPEETVVIVSESINTYVVTYPTHLIGTNSCDSVRILTLRVGNVFRDTTYDYVCDECTYDWTCPTQDGHTQVIKVQGDTISGEFVYKYDSLLTELGFDSIYVLKLYHKPTYHFTHKDTVCQFTDYAWDTHEGHTLYDVNRGIPTTAIRTDETGTFIFTDSLLTQTTFTDPHGVNTRTTACDSVWTLELFIPGTPSYADQLVVCDNDTVRWHNRLYVGDAFADMPEVQRMWENHEIDTFIVKPASEHKDSVYDETTFGCTITYRLALDVRAHSETRHYHAIGDNDSIWTFQPEGGNPANWHTASEFHVTDYTDPTREDRHFLFCDTLTNSAGCDSIVYDSVDVFPTYEFHEYETVCSNVPYDWRAEYTDRFRGLNYWPSNTYYDTCYTAARHLDSVFVLHLTIMPSFQKKTIQKICTNDTLDWHDEKIFFDPGEDETAQTIEYRQLYRRQSGCDSIFVMEATYYPYYHFFDTVTICPTDTLDWHGQRICWEGVYWDSLQTKACGCDSIYRLQVYNHPYYSFTQTDTVCQDTTGGVYTWYNEFGDVVPVTIALQNTGWASYSYTYPTTAHGCDSTFNINLYVTPIYRFDSLYTMCDNETITWQSRTFTGDKAGGTYAAGTYADTVTYSTRANGPLHACDSSYVLHLRVLPTDYVEWYDTICAGDSTLFCGYYVSEQKTYRDTLPNRHDCDSVCVLHLALRQMEHVTVDTTVCVGDILDFHAWHLTTPGTYIDTTLTEKGCWRETTLLLRHRKPTVVHASVDRVCADTSFYNVYYTFDGLRPKTYTILYDDSAHSHRFVDVVDAELTDSVLIVPMPDHDSKADYTRPDYYRATIFFGGVCLNDSLVMDSYEFLVRYPSWVIEQHWNDAIGILTASENGGYVFDAYQWFRNGQLLAGETSYYYFQPHYLIDQAQYGVYLTRQGERLAIPTCEITARVGDDDPLMPENNYVNVVPTAVHRQHPVVNILSPVPGSYTIIDTFGQIWKTGRYTPDAHNAFEVRIPAINGVYIFQLQADEGEKQVVKVLVQ